MELVVQPPLEDDSELSWSQLGLCAICFLCCYGLGRLGCWAMTRLITKGQWVASKLMKIWQGSGCQPGRNHRKGKRL